MDNGSEFINEAVNTILSEYLITAKPTAAYHPQSNGMTERANATISTILSKFSRSVPDKLGPVLVTSSLCLQHCRACHDKDVPVFPAARM